MNLGENKKITLALIEEYAPNNNMLTTDEDISNRLNLLYSTSYQELAQTKKIIKVTQYENTSEDEGYTKFRLPFDYYQLKKVNKIVNNNNFENANYNLIGKNIYLKNNANYLIEYYANPTIIAEETDNLFELEIDQDAQFILPYMVASDILKTDPSADYQSFYIEFKRKLDGFDTRNKIPTVILEEGVL